MEEDEEEEEEEEEEDHTTIVSYPSQWTVFMRQVTIVFNYTYYAEIPSPLLDTLPRNHLHYFSCNTGLSTDQFWRLFRTQRALKALNICITITNDRSNELNSVMLDSSKRILKPLKGLRGLSLGYDDLDVYWWETVRIAQRILQCHDKIKWFYIRNHREAAHNTSTYVWEANRARKWFTKIFKHGLEANEPHRFSLLSLADVSFQNSGDILVKAIRFEHLELLEIIRSHDFTGLLSSLATITNAVSNLTILRLLKVTFRRIKDLETILIACKKLKQLCLAGMATTLPAIDTVMERGSTLRVLLLDFYDRRHVTLAYEPEDLHMLLGSCTNLRELGVATCFDPRNWVYNSGPRGLDSRQRLVSGVCVENRASADHV
jgi:hypothetical protein